MTKITTFDKTTLKAMRVEMQAVLDKFAAKSNLEIEIGNMSFDPAEVNIKVKAKVKGAVTIDDHVLVQMTKKLGITKMVNTKGYKLLSYSSRARTYPFIYVKPSGARYKCSEQQAQKLFA